MQQGETGWDGARTGWVCKGGRESHRCIARRDAAMWWSGPGKDEVRQ